jgi:hypothetical protein
MARAAEGLLSKYKALSSNPRTTEKSTPQKESRGWWSDLSSKSICLAI